MREEGAARVPPLQPPHVRAAHRAYVHGRFAAARLRRRRARAAAGPRGVRILLYHRVTDERDPLAIPRDRFRRQLEGVRSAGFEIVPLREVYEVLARADDGLFAAITLDDGYLDALTDAEPILRELEAPATVFLPTGIVSRRERCTWYRRPPRFLDWDEVAELAASPFVEVQPHGVAHLDLPSLGDDDARDEMLGAVRELAERTGVASHTYSYAAGRYGPREQALVEASALLGAVTTDPGLNDAQTRRSCLRRTNVQGWETDREFRALLGGALDRPSTVRRLRALRRSG